MSHTRVVVALAIVFTTALAQGQPSAYLVKEINQTVAPQGSTPQDFLTLGNLLVFKATDALGASEVWRSDGSEIGTFRLGTGGRLCEVSNGRVWFTSPDGSLMSSDGTQPAQSVPVPAGLKPVLLIPSGFGLYFNASQELWRTDGTAAGTIKLSTAGPFLTSTIGAALAGQSGIFATIAASTGGAFIWRADAQPQQVMAIPAGWYLRELFDAGPLAYFQLLSSTTNQIDLWRTDGTPAGTFLLRASITQWSSIGAPHAYFTSAGQLWRTDGSLAGTAALGAVIPPNSIRGPYALGALPNGTLIFAAAPVAPPADPFHQYDGIWAFDGTNTTFLANIPRHNWTTGKAFGNVLVAGGDGEAWRTDGTVGGTYKLADLQGDSSLPMWPMAAINSTLFMSASGGEYGRELWKTDGTIPNTVLVRDIVAATHNATPKLLSALRGGVVFTAVSQGEDVNYSRELWFSDGTEGGTRKLLESVLLSPGELVSCGGRAYFPHTSAAGRELWSTDGTVPGTGIVKDLWPGLNNDGQPNSGGPQWLACSDDRLMFFAWTPGTPLWRSDGTAAGTLQVFAMPPGHSPAGPPVPFGRGVFFPLTLGSNDYLWLSDGTPAGTKSVKLIGPNVSDIVVAGYYAYFTTGFPGTLWRTDGSAAGTQPVPVPNDAQVRTLFPWGHRLAFQRWNAPAYCVTDGGAVSCFDSNVVQSTGPVFSMRPMNGRLYYNVPDLRSSDGASSITTGVGHVQQILAVAGGRLYFVPSQSPLRETDGTVAGTRTIFDGAATEAVASGGRLFIAGHELYAYDLPVTSTSLAPRTLPSSSGGQVVINGRGFAGPVTVTVDRTPVPVVSVTPTAIAFTAPPRPAGTYEISFINGDGREMTTDERLAYTCSPPTATVGAAPPAVCPFTPVQLSGGGGTRCSWFPSTGLNNPSSCNPIATVGATTTYTLIVSDATSCSSTNNPSVTVTVNPKPVVAITIDTPSHLRVPGGTYVATVADAGPGATYAWTVTGAEVVGAADQRSVTFRTRCELPKLSITVTSAAGCSTTPTSPLSIPLVSQLQVTGISPRWANAGTVITVTGSGFNCVTSLLLRDEIQDADVTVPFTPISATSLSFRLPATAPLRSGLQVINPFFQAQDPFSSSSPLTLLLRDDMAGLDKTTDLLTRNTGTGLTQLWWIGPNGITAPPQTKRAAGSTDYQVAGVYEFFGLNSSADILWQRSSTRQFSVQVSYGEEALIPRIPTADQVLAALGDLDGLGHPDFVMRNTVTGETQLWTFTGNWNTAVQTIHAGGNLGWKIVGSRDFDGDGKYDLLWRNTANGMTLVWLMDGATIRSSQIVHQGGNTDWQIAALGDFDADIRTDILWRHTPTGMTLLWRMNGATILQSTAVHPGGNLGWNIIGSGDFNGDAKADVLWRDSSPTGALLRWEMNGAQITKSSILMPSLDQAVKVESPRP